MAVELSCFSGLIFLAAPSNAYREHLLQALPSDNYTSQLGEVHRTLLGVTSLSSSVLMAWIVTLGSKLTGLGIASVSSPLQPQVSAPGGKVIMTKEEVAVHLKNMLVIAEALASKGQWEARSDVNQILLQMLQDIKLLMKEHILYIVMQN